MMNKTPCSRRKIFSSHFVWWLVQQTNIYHYNSFSVLPFLSMDWVWLDYKELWGKDSAKVK